MQLDASISVWREEINSSNLLNWVLALLFRRLTRHGSTDAEEDEENDGDDNF